MNARGALDGLIEPVERAARDAFARACAVAALGPVDLMLIAGPHVVAERGHLGECFAPGRINIIVDPKSPTLAAHLGRPLARVVAHELHHSLRHDGAGYGDAIGEAIVSEGLACRFVEELYGDPPEPWEDAVDPRPFVERAEKAWDAPLAPDHARWFFGRGDLPRWLGYSLGFALIGAFLDDNPATRPSTLANAPGRAFRPYLKEVLQRPRVASSAKSASH